MVELTFLWVRGWTLVLPLPLPLLLLLLLTAHSGHVHACGTKSAEPRPTLLELEAATDVTVVAPSLSLPLSRKTDLGPIQESLLHLVQALGRKFPLRGLASLATDVGVPGANHMLALLTPPREPQPSPWQRFKETFLWGESTPEPQELARSRSSSSLPVQSSRLSLSEELVSLVGSILGEQECLRKLACLSARHLSAWNGAPTVTLLLSTVTSKLPSQWLAPYAALRDALMYSESCSKYRCDHQQKTTKT